MAKINVVWSPLAESQLASIWTSAADPTAVTQAADTIDRKLKYNAFNAGEGRESSLIRLVLEYPLGTECEIIPDDNVVIVQWVRYIGY